MATTVELVRLHVADRSVGRQIKADAVVPLVARKQPESPVPALTNGAAVVSERGKLVDCCPDWPQLQGDNSRQQGCHLHVI